MVNVMEECLASRWALEGWTPAFANEVMNEYLNEWKSRTVPSFSMAIPHRFKSRLKNFPASRCFVQEPGNNDDLVIVFINVGNDSQRLGWSGSVVFFRFFEFAASIVNVFDSRFKDDVVRLASSFALNPVYAANLYNMTRSTGVNRQSCPRYVFLETWVVPQSLLYSDN